jgi:hypothetical protein
MYGKIMLVSWNMHSKKDGTVYIKRTLLRGPEPICNFRSNAERRCRAKQAVPTGKFKSFLRDFASYYW